MRAEVVPGSALSTATGRIVDAPGARGRLAHGSTSPISIIAPPVVQLSLYALATVSTAT